MAGLRNGWLTSGQEGLVRLWDAQSGQLQRGFSASESRIIGMAFSPDSHRLVTSGGRLVKIWDLAEPDGKPLVLAGHTEEVDDVAFSPDGQWVLSGAMDHSARLWDAASGIEVRRFTGHTDRVWGVRFSPDGKRIATASRDGTARVWDLASGQPLLQLSGHTSTVVAAVFSPDGRRIATASRDGTAKLWDATTGTDLLTLHGGDGGLNGVAFSPDGTRLATGGDLGLHVYVLPISELIQVGRSRLTRTWTLEECQRFLRLDRCPPIEPPSG
jgi:WD40 repeat protein